MPTLEARELAVSYGPLTAVHDVSFTVENGQILA